MFKRKKNAYIKITQLISTFLVHSSGEGVGAEEQAAVTIASVQQAAAFGDHNVQYQFRTENSGGQVSATFDLSRGSNWGHSVIKHDLEYCVPVMALMRMLLRPSGILTLFVYNYSINSNFELALIV